jgi:hypothetical protein
MSDDHLPGLAPPGHGLAGVTPLEAAVERTLARLEADGYLDPERDAGKRALALELAAVIALKRRTGRASTIGNDARVLLELLDGVVPDAGGEGDATLRQAMAEWDAFVKGGGA